MQEEVENRTVNLAITTTRLSVQTVVTGIRMYLNHRNNVSRQKVVQGIHGKQSVKELIGQNQGVSRMPIGDASIREFEREARKYGVDFAVTRDKTVDPPQYTVFFKARDQDALQQIAESLTAKQLNAQFHGKGGGKPQMVQGSLNGCAEEIRSELEIISKYFL